MNFKNLFDDLLLNEEEGGEILRFNKIKFFIAGRTEGKNPHMHFKDANREGAIRLDIPEYYPHGNPLKYTDKLTRRELKQFCALFNDEIYKEACRLWNFFPDGLKLSGENKPNYLTMR